jgi:hypothetical protein
MTKKLILFFYIIAGSARTTETTKSPGAKAIHGSDSQTKVQIQTDTHGKAVTHNRSQSHGKTGAHGTTKKSDTHKSRTNKQNKTDHDKNDPEKNNHTGTVIVFSIELYLTYKTIIKA